MTNLAEHSVRHYIGVLAEAAHIDDVANLVFTVPAEGLAAVDEVLAACSTLNTKVPRKPRKNDGTEKDGTGSSVDCDEVANVSGQSVPANLRDEIAELRILVAKLEVQVTGLKDRLDDSRYVISELFEVAKRD